jgi:hypothetical protein
MQDFWVIDFITHVADDDAPRALEHSFFDMEARGEAD